MYKKLKIFLLKVSDIIEIIIAIILTIAIIVAILYVFLNLEDFLNKNTTLNDIVEYSLTIVVAIEFIKMLIKNTPASVIEVILFAVSRQVIISHSGALENLIGVLSVAVVFGTWKYLFVPKFNDKD